MRSYPEPFRPRASFPFAVIGTCALLLLTGCAAGPGLAWPLLVAVLLLFFINCRPPFDRDRVDEFLLRTLLFSSGSSSGGSTTIPCTGSQDFTQSFDLSMVDLDATGAGFEVAGALANSKFARNVAGIGDFNGDGIGDLGITASYDPATDEGRVYIIFGRSGSGGDLDASTMTTAEGIHIEGPIASSYVGYDSVNAAGDVNGDGFDDILIGNTIPGAYTGEVYLIFGTAATTNISTTGLTTATGVLFQGTAGSQYTGESVTDVGDINGDGVDDFAIGAYNGASGNGEARVVYGKSSGFTTTPVSVTAITGTEGFTITGNSGGNQMSRAMAGIGDINGDGIDDMILGARFRNGSDGSAYVIYGKSGTRSDIMLSSLSAADGYELTGPANQWGQGVGGGGDFNGDGQLDIAVSSQEYNGTAGQIAVLYGDVGALTLSGLSSSQGFTLDGTSSEHAGTDISLAGDVNGDGLADLLVGAYEADISALNSGAAHLVFGRSDMPSSGTALGGYIGGTGGIRIEGPALNRNMGDDVDLADINGDNCADIILGGEDATGVGAAFVIFGGQQQ